MNRSLHPPGSRRGFVATVLVVTVAALLALLALVQMSIVRRTRLEAALLEARHARQWHLRGVTVLPADPQSPTARP